MSKFVHLISVGTSVLRNTYNEVRKCYNNNICSLPLNNYNRKNIEKILEALGYCVDPQHMNDIYCNRLVHRDSEPWSVAETLLFNNPFGLSAELNAMKLFINYYNNKCKVRELDEVILYHSDTYAGQVSAELIKEFLNKFCNINVINKKISGLGVFARLFEGLSNLVREVYCDIERYSRKGAVILLNLTGGFKPELGAFLLAGSLAGASAAYYIHEAARRPVFIPIIRVKPAYDPESFARVAEILASSKIVRPDEIPRYAWILYISEAVGLGRKLPDGSYELDQRRAKYLAEYIKRLASTDSCS